MTCVFLFLHILLPSQSTCILGNVKIILLGITKYCHLHTLDLHRSYSTLVFPSPKRQVGGGARNFDLGEPSCFVYILVKTNLYTHI